MRKGAMRCVQLFSLASYNYDYDYDYDYDAKVEEREKGRLALNLSFHDLRPRFLRGNRSRKGGMKEGHHRHRKEGRASE